MAGKTMLTRNPHVPTSIARVVVVGQDAEDLVVVNIDPLYNNPLLLRELGPGYAFSVRLWNGGGHVALLGGIGLAIFWHWWAFVPGIAIAAIIWRLNRRSVGDFVKEALAENASAASWLRARKLIWTVSPNGLLPDNT